MLASNRLGGIWGLFQLGIIVLLFSGAQGQDKEESRSKESPYLFVFDVGPSGALQLESIYAAGEGGFDLAVEAHQLTDAFLVGDGHLLLNDRQGGASRVGSGEGFLRLLGETFPDVYASGSMAPCVNSGSASFDVQCNTTQLCGGPSDPLCDQFSISNLVVSCTDQASCTSEETCVEQSVQLKGLIINGMQVPICVCPGPTFPSLCIVNPSLAGSTFGTLIWSGPICACSSVPAMPPWALALLTLGLGSMLLILGRNKVPGRLAPSPAG